MKQKVVNEIDPGQPNRYNVTEKCIRAFSLRQEATRSDATYYVKRLLVPTSESYQLFFNNCRDHTDRAINNLCWDGQCSPKGKKEALRNTQARRYEDTVIGLGLCLVGSIAVGYIFWRKYSYY